MIIKHILSINILVTLTATFFTGLFMANEHYTNYHQPYYYMLVRGEPYTFSGLAVKGTPVDYPILKTPFQISLNTAELTRIIYLPNLLRNLAFYILPSLLISVPLSFLCQQKHLRITIYVSLIFYLVFQIYWWAYYI